MLGASTLSHPSTFPLFVAAALLSCRARGNIMPASNTVVYAVSYVLVSMLLIPVLKDAFTFPRPIEVFGAGAIKLIGHSDPHHSFPSGHSAFAVLTAAALAPHARMLARAALIMFAALACVSRIWVGAHFPADVAGGALIALLGVALCRALLDRGRENVTNA